MTRKAILVNESNWMHEDYEVTIVTESSQSVTSVAPGEMITLPSYGEEIIVRIKPTSSGTPIPNPIAARARLPRAASPACPM